MRPLDVVMINMSNYAEWQNGVSNRNYHILQELSHSDAIGKIIAIDYPPLTFKRSLRNYKESLLRPPAGGTVIARSATRTVTKLSERLYIYSNVSFFMRPELFIKDIRQQIVKLGLSDFLVWSYFPPIMPFVRSLGQKLTVFDAVDNWIEHPSYAQFRTRLSKDYETIKNSADIIFTVAEDLQALFDHQPNAYWIPNGVDLTHYQDIPLVINRDIADIPRPIIGYIGVIQDRVDIDLITFLAEKNPTKSFVIIGPVWREEHEKKLAHHQNIHLLGYKPYQEAPEYIQQFDVALIPHKPSPFVTSTNPMKLYEYLACGKPVVATAGAGVDAFKDLIYIASDKEDFHRKIFHALEEDTEELRRDRMASVQHYSWSSIVKQMLDIVHKKLTY